MDGGGNVRRWAERPKRYRPSSLRPPRRREEMTPLERVVQDYYYPRFAPFVAKAVKE